jgi:hypothetical protein
MSLSQPALVKAQQTTSVSPRPQQPAEPPPVARSSLKTTSSCQSSCQPSCWTFLQRLPYFVEYSPFSKKKKFPPISYQ